jgi:NitT/TauT family transport system permease protein
LFQSSIFLIVLLVLWFVVVRVLQPPAFLLPPPEAVWDSITSETLRWWHHSWITTQTVIGGYVIGSLLGIGLALVIAWSPLLSNLVLPTLIIFNNLPKVAVAPLFIIYFGYGIAPNIAITALIVFFPVVLNMLQGLLQTSPDLLEMARTLGAKRHTTFLRLRIPSSLPFLLVGLRIAAPFAVTGAVFGEFIASQAGLGNMIIQTQTNLNMHHAFAALFWLSLIGLALFIVVDWGGRFLFPWAEIGREENRN